MCGTTNKVAINPNSSGRVQQTPRVSLWPAQRAEEEEMHPKVHLPLPLPDAVLMRFLTLLTAMLATGSSAAASGSTPPTPTAAPSSTSTTTTSPSSPPPSPLPALASDSSPRRRNRPMVAALQRRPDRRGRPWHGRHGAGAHGGRCRVVDYGILA